MLSAAVTSSLPDINEAMNTLFLMQIIMALERSCLNTIEAANLWYTEHIYNHQSTLRLLHCLHITKNIEYQTFFMAFFIKT